jgi:anti-sigma factor RsiW
MNPCEKQSAKILLYLDKQLKDRSLEDFSAHVRSCAACQARLEEEIELSRLLHQSRPLYSAPEALRARVVAMAWEHGDGSDRARDRVPPRRWQILTEWWHASVPKNPYLRALTATVTVGAIGLAFAPGVMRQAHATAYVNAAVATHAGYLEGKLPLDVSSGTPERASAWFAGKVPFHFQLPTAHAAPDNKPDYRIVGVSDVNYKGSRAAFVAYERQNQESQKETVSLLVASSESADVAGGTEVQAGSLVFHYRDTAEFRVITWVSHGQSYALVAPLSVPARESCLVCHQNMADRGTFRTSSRGASPSRPSASVRQSGQHGPQDRYATLNQMAFNGGNHKSHIVRGRNWTDEILLTP